MRVTPDEKENRNITENRNNTEDRNNIGKKILVGILILGFLIVPAYLKPPAAMADGFSVRVWGDGVKSDITFTQEELEARASDQVCYYSAINNFPTKKYYVGKGVELKDLLGGGGAGIKTTAKTIIVTASDGYEQVFTKQELLDDPRKYYPNLTDNAEYDGSVPGDPREASTADTILALQSIEGSRNPDGMSGSDAPLLLMGQRYITEQNNPWFVKYVRSIEVSTEEPDQWDSPTASVEPGEVEAGTEVELSSNDMNWSKIYYSTNGSTPTYSSTIYDWIAERFWGDREDVLDQINKPITITKTMTIKAITIGAGKKESSVATFTYTVPGSSGDGGGGGGGGGGDSGGSDSTSTGASGSVVAGGNNTAYNQKALAALATVTTQQIQNAQLPADAPAVSPTGTSPVTLTTPDGVRLVVPAGAVNNQAGPVNITVALGSVTTAPKAEPTAVILNPLKYQRQFGIDGQTDGSVSFTAPVTISFPITLSDLPSGTSASELAVYWWNPNKNDWVKLGGVFDSENSTLSVPTYHFSTYAVMADTSPAAARLTGANRFATAVAVAEQGWKAGADNVVIANAYSFPDALAAGPLAYKLGAPILLTDPAKLTSATQAEIQKLSPQKITLIGGTGVISQAIEDALGAAYGKDNVVRYGGENRYATAAAIASALGTTGKAVVANGENGHYADALTISSYAAYNGIPILFTQKSALPEATGKALTAQKVNATVVAGGEGVVAAQIFNSLPGGVRYGGANRYATATAIATGLKLNLSRVYVVTGLDFPDALVAGNLAAHTQSPLIMVDKQVPEATGAFLSGNKAAISGLTLVGGEGAISAAQGSALQQAI